MGWKKYALTLLLVNAVMVFVGYAIFKTAKHPVFESEWDF